MIDRLLAPNSFTLFTLLAATIRGRTLLKNTLLAAAIRGRTLLGNTLNSKKRMICVCSLVEKTIIKSGLHKVSERNRGI